MDNLLTHIIYSTDTVKLGLEKLNSLASYLTLFVINELNQLIGTVTDGDIRRALLRNVQTEDLIEKVMQKNFVSLKRNSFTVQDVKAIKERKIFIVPIVDEDNKIIRIINLEKNKSILPIDAFIMAGGEGKRLRPLTLNTPKPLLVIGDKPIIKHNTNRLEDYGVDNIYISVKYLSNQIIEYYTNQPSSKASISFVQEEKPLGTIGSIKLVNNFSNDVILVMNSDLLTNINFEDFYESFINSQADMAVATIPYNVTVPYAVVETKDGFITDLKEKPTYTYYSNAGIYLIKKELLNIVPQNNFYNATDLMEEVIGSGRKIYSYPILDYWLDIGKPDDFTKAIEDIKHLKL